MSKSVVACHVMRKPLGLIVYCTTFPATIMPNISHLYVGNTRLLLTTAWCLLGMLYREPRLGASHLGPSQRLQG